MKQLRSCLRRFTGREDGSVIVEAVLVLPALCWAAFALYSYWDIYRSINSIQKASYTVSDTISRRMEPINMAYLTGLRDLMDFMLDTDQNTQLRVTSITYNLDETRFEVLWSKSPDDAFPELTTELLQPMAVNIPAMTDGDTVVLVETKVAITPNFDVGLGDTDVEEFIVTRPRMAPKVCFVAC
jgi:Flp pilus assembly protein TadG